VATPLLDARGRPDPLHFTRDRLHLNANGYAAWRAVVRPWVEGK
jgi:lysophospholipase L1-like esterase